MTKISDEHWEGIYKALAKIADEAERLTGCGVLVAIGMHNDDENMEGAYVTKKLTWEHAAKITVGINGIISDYYGNHGSEHEPSNEE